jgi:hypothetical protein
MSGLKDFVESKHRAREAVLRGGHWNMTESRPLHASWRCLNVHGSNTIHRSNSYPQSGSAGTAALLEQFRKALKSSLSMLPDRS